MMGWCSKAAKHKAKVAGVAGGGNRKCCYNACNIWQKDPHGLKESGRETENSSGGCGSCSNKYLLIAMVKVEGYGAEYGSSNS